MYSGKQRWKYLRAAVLQKTTDIFVREGTTPALTSSGTFESFGLLAVRALPIAGEEQWFEYSCSLVPDFRLTIRHCPKTISLEQLTGFNNTGNICVWSSEEVLAYHCLRHKDCFSERRVCELGAGMTGLAGLSVAAAANASKVVLTDGNELSVANIAVNAAANASMFGSTSVTTSCVVWDSLNEFPEYKKMFDYILCADCLFFRDCHDSLLHTMLTFLKDE
ncbi:calmodulin-lysine N-methyltransferase-like isoform X2 [Corticium candelabrum]|nr:calmodulin-lysine N-methyltransferase-like isoform X2 [Corticium candelabrum]